MKFSLLLILLIIPLVLADPLDADTMDAQVTIKNTVTFEQAGGRYNVDEASATLTWFPRQTRLQEVISLDTEPNARRTDNSILFTWDNPRMSETVVMSSVIRTKKAIIPVRDQVRFPLADVPPELAIYLEPGEITDQSREIQALAQQLAAGKTDAYEVVYSLADWTTRNVNYSLASVGQPAIQSSSEVLLSRYGKCDELTALFISMNRALGIPARFVAGYAYTTSEQFAQPWGGHGWAEVWLPGQGWVPFDVTYGEYGYLDASHIVLKTAPDAKETSIDYYSRGNDFELRTKPLEITVTPTKLTTRENTDISISVSAPQQRVGFGSSALILAEVQNNRDYYVSTRLDLTRTANTQLIGDPYKNVLLRPNERKSIPFLVKLDSGLRPGYSYTFPFTVRSRLGPQGGIDIRVEQAAPVFDASAFAEEIDRYTQSTPSVSFSILCDKGKAGYVGETIVHDCALIGVEAARICDTSQCEDVAGEFQLTSRNTKAGVFTKVYTATANGESSRFFVTSRSATPTLLSAIFDAPEQVSPSDDFDVQVELSSTGALPRDVNVTLEAHHSTAMQRLPDLGVPATLLYTLDGRSLRPGANEILLTATYRDEIGSIRTDTFTQSIDLVNVTFGDRVLFVFEDTGYWIVNLFRN